MTKKKRADKSPGEVTLSVDKSKLQTYGSYYII